MQIEETKAKMDKAIAVLKGELAKIRTSRATPTLIEDVKITLYGDQKLMVKEVATISTPEHNQLLLVPWDKSQIAELANQIQKANLGLTPVVEGEQIRITIPPLTEERRKEFIKGMGQTLEKFRVEIRQIRQDLMQDLKRQKESGKIGEDEEARLSKELQTAVDKKIEEIEEIGKKKEAELLEV
jgi:ribosome recycling factor